MNKIVVFYDGVNACGLVSVKHTCYSGVIIYPTSKHKLRMAQGADPDMGKKSNDV